MSQNTLESNEKVGRSIRLIYTDDPYTKLKPGAMGKVTRVAFIDGQFTIGGRWEDGSALSLIGGVDSWHILTDEEEFVLQMEKYVSAAYGLLTAWQSVENNSNLQNIIDDIKWPFAMSFDEYVAEMNHHLDSIKDKLKTINSPQSAQ